MTLNQTFQEWTLITDEPGDDFIWEHGPTGNRVRFDKDGGFHSKSIQTDELLTAGRAADILVYKRSGTVYAVGNTSVVDSGSDAATVIQSAIDNLPTGGPQGGTIYIATGVYELSSTINLKEAVTLRGSGSSFPEDHGTVLKAADGLNSDLVVYDEHTSDRASFTELEDIALNGNSANNTSGDGFVSGSNEIDVRLFNVGIDDFVGVGARIGNAWGLLLKDSVIENCGSYGVFLEAGGEGKVVDNKIIQNSNTNLLNQANNVKVRGNELANSDTDSCIRVAGQHCTVENNRLKQSSGPQAIVNAADAKFVDNNIDGDNSHEAFKLNSNADRTIFASNTITNVTSYVTNPGNDPRPVWEGQVGGGPFGGVDLSSVTGDYDNEMAVADGTSSANAGDLAKWDAGNTQWDVFQPEATV